MTCLHLKHEQPAEEPGDAGRGDVEPEDEAAAPPDELRRRLKQGRGGQHWQAQAAALVAQEAARAPPVARRRREEARHEEEERHGQALAEEAQRARDGLQGAAVRPDGDPWGPPGELADGVPGDNQRRERDLQVVQRDPPVLGRGGGQLRVRSGVFRAGRRRRWGAARAQAHAATMGMKRRVFAAK